MQISRRSAMGLAVGVGALAAGGLWNAQHSRSIERAGVFEAGIRDIRHLTPGLLASEIEVLFPDSLVIRLAHQRSREVTVAQWRWRETVLEPTGQLLAGGRKVFDLDRRYPLINDLTSRARNLRPDTSVLGPQADRILITADGELLQAAIHQSNGVVPLTITPGNELTSTN